MSIRYRQSGHTLSVIVRRLMVIVIRDSDLSRVRVHVNHLDPELLLQVAALSMYPGLFVPAGVFPLAVFLHLDKSNTVLVHDNEIDRGRVLARRKDPVPQPHKMFGTDQLAKVAVNVARVRCIPQNGSSAPCARLEQGCRCAPIWSRAFHPPPGRIVGPGLPGEII